jgi:hypothetical protein
LVDFLPTKKNKIKEKPQKNETPPYFLHIDRSLPLNINKNHKKKSPTLKVRLSFYRKYRVAGDINP